MLTKLISQHVHTTPPHRVTGLYIIQKHPRSTDSKYVQAVGRLSNLLKPESINESMTRSLSTDQPIAQLTKNQSIVRRLFNTFKFKQLLKNDKELDHFSVHENSHQNYFKLTFRIDSIKKIPEKSSLIIHLDILPFPSRWEFSGN